MSSKTSHRGVSYGSHSHSINKDLEEEDVEVTQSVSQTLVSSVANSILKFKETFRGRRTSAYKARRLRSKGALLVLLWNFLVFSYQHTALGTIVKLFNGIKSPWELALTTVMLQDCVPKLLYPIAGWIADAKVGRYKVMRTSLLIMWIGSIGLVLVYILNYRIAYIGSNPKSPVETENYTLAIVVLVYILNAIGIAGFHANVIPFGIDQMEDGSAEQYSAFIHWYYWTRNCSLGILVQFALQSMSVYCNKNYPRRGIPQEPVARFDTIIVFVQCISMTAAVCLDFLLSNKLLNKDPKTHYPLQQIWKVSKFVVRNKEIVGQRKAITFTYDAPPSRWDFAKHAYGGPFEEEDVEEVKTFWRIVVFLFSIGLGSWFVITTVSNINPTLVSHMRSPVFFQNNSCTGYNLITTLSSPLSFTVLIPIYEFLIYPCFRKYILRMILRIGAGMVILLLGLSSLVVIDSVGHTLTNSTVHCMLYNFTTNEDESLGIQPGVLAPIIFVMAIGEMMTAISAFELICAQSPYNMRGILIGLLYASAGLFIGLTGLVLLTFSLVFKHIQDGTDPLSCGSWYLLASVLIGLLGIVVYFVAGRWYKKRRRGDQAIYNQATLESCYNPIP